MTGALWSRDEVKTQAGQTAGQVTLGEELGTCCESPEPLDVFVRVGAVRRGRTQCDSCGTFLTMRQAHAAHFGVCGASCHCWGES